LGLHYYWFGLVAAPVSVVVWVDNAVTLRSEIRRSVTRVWSFSWFGVNRRLRVGILGIYFLFDWVSVWTDHGGRGNRFISYAYLKY
jgi:hypothetical protein